ncbi:hypothetical protein GCM10027579_03730 [Calidifontibacter terrae]
MSRLSELNQFYVALYRDESTVVFPYSVMNDQFCAPEVQHFGARGLCAWMRASRHTYRWHDDNGALILRGQDSGAEQQLRDGVVVPLMDPGAEDPIGFMAFLSAEAGAFDDESVRCAEWLARALVVSVRRDQEDAVDLDIYHLYPELDSSAVRSEEDLVHLVADRLSHLGAALDDVLRATHSGDLGAARAAARNAQSVCERAQVEAAELLVRQNPPAPDPLQELTEREREIALLISQENLPNAAIAQRLFISEKTVKGHVGNVLRKLGVSQRSAIAWIIAQDPDESRSLGDSKTGLGPVVVTAG